MAKAPLTKRPHLLYLASLEHIAAMDTLRRERRWVLAIYAGGLAVECVLQAVALRRDPTDDVRHDLRVWLSRCPVSLHDAMRDPLARHWSFLNTVWSNSLRYLSQDGLLGHLRALQLNRGVRGGYESVLKLNCDRLAEAARAVHGIGAIAWLRTS